MSNFWVSVAVAIVAVLVAIALFVRSRSSGAETVPSEMRLGIDQLRATLEQAGVNLQSTNIPNVEILRPYLSTSDSFLGAIQARRGSKRAILVALDDRLVAGEATLDTMGAEVFQFRWEEIDDFEQSYEIGGQLEFESAGNAL